MKIHMGGIMEKKGVIDFVANMIKTNKDFIFEKGKSTYEKELIKSTKAFQEYYIRSVSKYSRMKNIINNAIPVNLQSIYVPIDLEYGSKEISTDSLIKVIMVDRNIIIRGAGGSGKSTILKYLFLDALNYDNYVPIFIELKNLNTFRKYKTQEIETEEEYLIDYIHFSMTKFKFNLNKSSLIYAFENAPIILFLDGFDEIDDEIEQLVSVGINNLSTTYTNLRIIMTSRQIEDGFASWSNFTEMKVKKLSKVQSKLVISNINYNREVKNRFLLELDEKLYKSHESFASNPLLVIIMLLTFSEFAEIPEKIYLFYQESFEVMFRKHDASKEGTLRRTLKSRLSKDDFENVLSCFAWLGQNERKLEFGKKELLKYMDQCRKITDIHFNEEQFIDDLITSVCILNLEGRIYSYSHRSFQEYFTAVFILNSTEEIQKKLISNLVYTYPKDSILDLIFEMNPNVVEKQLIIPILLELYEITKPCDNNDEVSFIKYCNLVYRMVGWQGNGSRVFPKLDSEGKKYNCIMNFVRKNYLEKNRKVFGFGHPGELTRFEPEKLYSDEELKKEFLAKSTKCRNRYFLTYELLNNLVKKHESKLNIVDELILMRKL